MDSRISFLFEHSSDIFCVFDINGNIVRTNASFGHFTNYTASEIKGRNISEICNPDDKDKVIELLQTVISPQNIDSFLLKIKKQDGSFISFSWSFCFNHSQQFIYGIGIYTAENLNIRNSHNLSDKIQHVLANLAEGFFMLDENWCINAFNPAFREIINVSAGELYGADFRLLNNRIIADEVIPKFENAFKNNVPSQVQYFDPHFKGWLRLNIYPYKGEVIAFIRDVTSIKVQQLILALEKNVLEWHLLASYTLSQLSNKLLLGIESIFPEMYCSILEVDDKQEKIYHLAAPRLPEEYCKAINGSGIGPAAGSCGTAAYHREQVIVKDIEHSPLWTNYKKYILPYGLKACWSTPVISSQNNNVLATFAIYYNTIREPKPEELQMIERTVNILRVLIESKKSNERVADQTKRLQDIASISSHNIRRPVATILGLVNLFDRNKLDNPLNKEVVEHLETTAAELDEVIHIIVEKTINM